MEVFKEVSLGGISREQFIQQLTDSGVQFNEYAKTLFANRFFYPKDEIEKVKTVKLKLTDLGLGKQCSYQAIIIQAVRRGFKPCPLVLGAFLRLSYKEQSTGPYLTIVSSLLEEDGSQPTGFYLRNFDNSLWLRGYRAIGEADWPPDNEFVFLK